MSEHERSSRFGPPRPILLVVSGDLVLQWASEIAKYFPVFKIYIYYGAVKQKSSKYEILSDGSLTRDNFLFAQDNEDLRRSIVVTTHDTFQIRHRPTAVKQDVLKKSRDHTALEGTPNVLSSHFSNSTNLCYDFYFL